MCVCVFIALHSVPNAVTSIFRPCLPFSFFFLFFSVLFVSPLLIGNEANADTNVDANVDSNDIDNDTGGINADGTAVLSIPDRRSRKGRNFVLSFLHTQARCRRRRRRLALMSCVGCWKIASGLVLLNFGLFLVLSFLYLDIKPGQALTVQTAELRYRNKVVWELDRLPLFHPPSPHALFSHRPSTLGRPPLLFPSSRLSL